jgi:hypothetical protein
MKPFFTLRLRPPARLGARMALMTLIALAAIQALNFAAFLLLPHPEPAVYGAHWLARQVEQTVTAVYAAPEGERPSAAQRIAREHHLRDRMSGFTG